MNQARAGGPTQPPSRDWRLRIGGPVGAAVLRLLAATWRIEFRSDASWRKRHAGRQGVVLTVWHGELLPLAYAFRNLGILVVVSEHRDGEIIAQLLHRLGFGTIRGSTTRGGTRALAKMIRELKSGATVGVTPDGPRGPAHAFAPGALVGAYRAGVPIVTLRARVTRAWRFQSWDRFMLPKPFARIIVEVGEPTSVAGASPAEAAADAARFEALMGRDEGRAGA